MDPDDVGTFPADDFATIFFGFPLLLFATAMPSRARSLLLYLGLPISAALLLMLLRVCVKRRRQLLEQGAGDKSSMIKTPKSQEVTREIKIPSSYTGYVIGRGGSTIRKLREDYSVKIYFDDGCKDSKDTTLVEISGGPENVDRAEAAIKQLIHDKESQPEPIKIVIPIPVEFIGRIIGKQGATIRQLQKESGAKLTVDRGENPANGKKDVTIVGQSAEVDYACELLKELLERFSPRTTPTPHKSPPFKPILQPGRLPASTEPFSVKISSVDADGTLWLQVVNDNLPKLDTLVSEMTVYYEKQGKILGQPAPGDYCGAKFEFDNSWYRAKLIELKENGQWDVLFVDYGDQGSWNPNQLMELRPQFCELRCQAVKCYLAGIHYTESPLSTECLKYLDELTLCEDDKNVMVVAEDTDTDPVLVSISYTDSGEDVDLASKLVEKGFARRMEDKEPKEEVQLASVRFSPVNDVEETDSLPTQRKRNRSFEVCASSEEEPDHGEKEVDEKEYSLQEESVVQSQYFVRESDTASVMLQWRDGDATTVGVEGSFTDGGQKELSMKEGVFSGTFDLPVGKHVFSFIVDGVRTHRHDMPTIGGMEENGYRNYITVEKLIVQNTEPLVEN